MKAFLTTAIAILLFTVNCKAQWSLTDGNIYPTVSSNSLGIGTITPAGKFQVVTTNWDLLTGTNNLDIGARGAAASWVRALRVVNTSGSDGTDGGTFGVKGSGATPGYVYMAIPTASYTGYNSTKILALDNSGNVGIGTTDPQGYKLAVNGSAIAVSMTVKLYASWPDFVFNPTYKLPALSAVKNYIDNNHHLPEIPSASEIAKNGQNLGEMNALLLKKVEELTLYLIDKDKQVLELSKRDTDLQLQLKVLNEKVAQLVVASNK